MKKLAAITLALIMCMGIAACGDSSEGSSAKGETSGSRAAAAVESKAQSGDSESETPAEETNAAPEDYVPVEFKNVAFGMSGTIYVPPIEGMDWDGSFDAEFERNDSRLGIIMHGAETGHYVAVDVWFYPYSADSKQSFAEDEEYSKTEVANGYDAYTKNKEGSAGLSTQTYLFGGEILDGYTMMSISCENFNSPVSDDVFNSFVDELLKYVSIDAADESALVTDSGDLVYAGYDITIPKEVTIGGSTCEITPVLNGANVNWKTSFEYDGMEYELGTWNILND